jgi:large subunit ribosomal protein L21
MERHKRGGTGTAAAEPAVWAVLRTGGKQYVVRTGDRLNVARSDYLAATVRDADGRRFHAFDDILMLGSGEGTVVGSPNVPNARVIAELLPEKRGPKTVSFKKRRRQNSRRMRGHRQVLQPVLIVSVEPGDGPFGEMAWRSVDRSGPAERGRLAGAAVPHLHASLRWGGPGQAVETLREVATRSWSDVAERERREVERSLEPLLTAPDARLRAASALALATVTGVPAGGATPDAVADALTRYFARTGRRHFAEVALRADAARGTGPDGLAHYRATVSLRDRLDLPSGNATVRLGQGIPVAAHVEVNVSGPGIDLGSRRVIARGEKPAGTVREAVVCFGNDHSVGDSAILDVVVDGRRIERRFLSLSRLAITRDPPALPGSASWPAAYAGGLIPMPNPPAQGSASSL